MQPSARRAAPEEWNCWEPQLEWTDLPLGQVLYESGNSQSHIYFPTTSIVPLLYVMENGASAEIAAAACIAAFALYLWHFAPLLIRPRGLP